MISIQTNGLMNVSPYMKADMPLLLTDDHEVLEAPTLWLSNVFLRKSRSIETLKQYTSIISRYLQWMDDTGYKAVNWQSVDEDVIKQYVEDLLQTRDEYGSPSNKTIEFYAARLQDFYKWAKKNGYKHYWDMGFEQVEIVLNDQALLKTTIYSDAKEIKLSSGQETAIRNERDKYLSRESFNIVIKLFDDEVYRVLTLFVWMTALRPKDLFQVPFIGKGKSCEIRRYRSNELDTIKDLYFEFESKGKTRSIEIPSDLWQYICKVYMPLRQKRALLYKEKHGVSPPNSALFLSKNGSIVSKKMLSDQLKKVREKVEIPERRLTAGMLRHSFATYFIHEALKNKNMIGKPYIYDAVIDNELKKWMGHTNIGTTYKFYVHLVNTIMKDDLIYDLRKIEYGNFISELDGS